MPTMISTKTTLDLPVAALAILTAAALASPPVLKVLPYLPKDVSLKVFHSTKPPRDNLMLLNFLLLPSTAESTAYEHNPGYLFLSLMKCLNTF